MINDYKLTFAWKRLLKTASGGVINLIPEDSETSYTVISILLQFIFFFLPWIISAPLSFIYPGRMYYGDMSNITFGGREGDGGGN